MTHEILANGDLKIMVDAEERNLLATLKEEDPEAFDRDATMLDFFEGFIGNNEFQWTRPEYCGALTDAPMLGIYGHERALKEDEDGSFLHVVGHWDDTTWVEDVTEAWGFMDYMIISVQERLLDDGEAVFTHG